MNKILKGAGVLAFCSLIAKMIGALYRIPLTNIVGAEGIGLYQMVFPLYTVLLTVSSGGLPVAISKVVSGKIAEKDEAGARQVLKVSLLTLSIAGLACGAAIVFLRNKIAFVQGNEKAGLPYLGIAPSLFFVAIIACFRGYFQGKQNMLPSAISQIVEQSIKLLAGLSLATLLIKHSLEMAVLGALLGVSLSELVAMLILLFQYSISYIRQKKRSKINVGAVAFETAEELSLAVRFRPHKKSSLIKEVYKIAIPVTLGSLVMPMTQVIDSILVINLLVEGGVARSEATSLFGLVTGPINSLINMPVVLTLSLAVALLPRVAECFKKGENIERDVSKTMKFSFILGLFSALLLSVFATPILQILYKRGLSTEQIKIGATLLRLGGISVLYVSILQVATSVLQGSDMAHKPALNLLYGAVFKVILTLALLPIFGINGAMTATVLCYGITCVLDVYSMKKCCPLSLNFKEFLLVPLFAGGGFIVTGIFLFRLLSSLIAPLYALITAGTVASTVFIVIMLVFKAIKREEIESLPFVKKLIKKHDERKAKKRERQANALNGATKK